MSLILNFQKGHGNQHPHHHLFREKWCGYGFPCFFKADVQYRWFHCHMDTVFNILFLKEMGYNCFYKKQTMSYLIKKKISKIHFSRHYFKNGHEMLICHFKNNVINPKKAVLKVFFVIITLEIFIFMPPLPNISFQFLIVVGWLIK